MIKNAPDAGTAAKRLIDVAKWCGGPDNATLAVVEFPVQLSETLGIEDGLQVWDAFGELHIQLQHTPSQIQFEDPVVLKKSSPLPPTQDRDQLEDDSDPQLLEDAAPKRKPRRKKAPPKAKRATDPLEQDAPQLDIEFSTKAKD